MKQLFLFVGLLLSMLTYGQKNNDRGYIVKVGDKAPNIQIEYLSDKKVSLSSFKGKVIMIQFTASWCGVCRKEMPIIEEEIWKKHKGNEDFVLLGIDLKESKMVVENFKKITGITYPLTLDESGKSFYSFAAKGAGVTRNVIIDREGKIIFMTRLFERNEFDTMKKVIETELKK